MAPVRRSGEFPQPSVRVVMQRWTAAPDIGELTTSFPLISSGRAAYCYTSAPKRSVPQMPPPGLQETGPKDAAAPAAGGDVGREAGTAEACCADLPPLPLQTLKAALTV